MRAWAVVENAAPLQEIELPTPEPTGTQVLMEVTHCGVCHSDLHVWEGKYDLGGGRMMNLKDRGVVLPLAMGHEIVGRVVKLGPDAEGVAVGDLRIVYPWVGCGKCAACTSDEDNMCLTPRSIGIFQNGGYATHVLAHASAPSGRSRYARSGAGGDLCMLRHHRLFGRRQGDADAAGRTAGAGGRRWAGAECTGRAEGDGASQHHRGGHLPGEARCGAGGRGGARSWMAAARA